MSLTVPIWPHRRALTRALAAGAEPSSSPELARRAEQLTSPASRRKLADGLYGALRAAEAPPRPLSTVIAVQRREIVAAREEIERLAETLLAPGEVRAGGVALVEDLLTDSTSPLFTAGPDGELDRALRRAHAALLAR